MVESESYGTVGVIKPTRTSPSFKDLQRILPQGIGLEPIYLDIRYRSLDEFREVMAAYEARVPELAAKGVDLIHPEGAPPFMLEGLSGERARIQDWEERFKVPVFTTGMTQLAAMAALGIRSFVGITPFSGELAKVFYEYFTDAGYHVQAMTTPVGENDSSSVYDRPAEDVPGLVAQAFRDHGQGAEALYILGSDWPVFENIEKLEQALGVPVLHPVAVRCWYIQKHLGMRRKVPGYGRLLAEIL